MRTFHNKRNKSVIYITSIEMLYNSIDLGQFRFTYPFF